VSQQAPTVQPELPVQGCLSFMVSEISPHHPHIAARYQGVSAHLFGE
jgi:hypothetical protein